MQSRVVFLGDEVDAPERSDSVRSIPIKDVRNRSRWSKGGVL